MAFTYSIATDRGKVRLLCSDRVDVGHIFEDDEIDSFLTLEGGVKRAAACGLETIAADQALTVQAIRLLHLQMDGPAVAKSLLDRAARLREQADAEEANADAGAFDIAELVTTDFAYRERAVDEALRDG